MAVLVFFLCLIEFSVWYLAALDFFEPRIGIYATVIGVVFGIMMSTVIWIVDSLIITYDFSNRSGNDFREKFQNRFLKILHRIIFYFLRLITTDFFRGILGRSLIFAITLLVTAAIIARILFAEDISKQVEEHNAKIRYEILRKLTAEEEAVTNELRNQISILEQNYRDEVLGKGPSGLKKEGPIARSYLNAAKSTRDRLREISDKFASERDALKTLSRQEIEGKYNVELLGDETVYEKAANVTAIFEDKSKFTALLIFEGMVAVVFLSIILGKFFQPRSLAVYYNEEIQGAYPQYMSGAYDDILSDEDKSTAIGPIVGPLQFERIFYRIIELQNASESSIEEGKRIKSLKGAIRELQGNLDQADSERQVLEKDLQTMSLSIEKLENQIRSLSLDKSSLIQLLEAKNTQLTELENRNVDMTLDDKSVLHDIITAANEEKKLIKDEIIKYQHDLRQSDALLGEKEARLASEQAEKSLLIKSIMKSCQVIDLIEDQKKELANELFKLQFDVSQNKAEN